MRSARRASRSVRSGFGFLMTRSTIAIICSFSARCSTSTGRICARMPAAFSSSFGSVCCSSVIRVWSVLTDSLAFFESSSICGSTSYQMP